MRHISAVRRFGPGPRTAGARAIQPQRLRDHPLRWTMHTRPTFLADIGMGFTGLALGALLARDGVARPDTSAWSPPDGKPHFPPKAKSVIWLFMVGGASHVEGFDPKPALTTYAGKTIAETPFKTLLDSPHLKKNLREF